MLTEERRNELRAILKRQDRIMRRLKGKPPLPGEQEATDEEMKDFLSGEENPPRKSQ